MSRQLLMGPLMALSTSAWALAMFIFMVACIATSTTTFATAHPDLIRAIRCPVCDYTTSSMVKTVLAGHRLCAINGGKSTDDVECQQIKEWTGWEESALPPLAKSHEYPTKQFGASPAWVKNQVLPSACSHHVFKAFPVGTSSPQSQQTAPGEEEEELNADGQPEYKSYEEKELARRAKIQKEYDNMKATPREPVDENYRAAIREACEMDFSPKKITKDRKERMGHWLYNETMNAIFDDEVMAAPSNKGVNEVFAKRRDYRRVLTMQRYYCGKACGTINRPDGDEGPDRDVERGVLSWNADGEYISRNHIP